MKKVLSIFALICLCTTTTLTQTVNGVPIAKMDSEFIIITKRVTSPTGGTITLGSSQLNVGLPSHGRLIVEFGNGVYATNLKRRRPDEAEIRDENGDVIILNSAAHALSFIEGNGFRLIDTNITPFGAESLMFTYMMARPLEPTASN